MDFVHLFNASFYSAYLSPEMQSDPYSHRLTQNKFTYRVEYLRNDRPLYAIHWWIAEQVSLSYSVEVLFIFII
jgi:hypothetical protein